MTGARHPEHITTARALVQALRDAGVEVIFANFGSDHAQIIEALALDRSEGQDAPAVVLCPHEITAVGAAHGFALATGRPQAVFVHTDVGTANMGGSVHNAARSHVPVLIFAGETPFTIESELPGTRNTPINFLQEVRNQHHLVEPYVKWSYAIRTGTNVRQLVFRALQLARSAPPGPVYLTGAREVLAETVPAPRAEAELWQPIEPVAVPAQTARQLVTELSEARFPLIITSHLGRNPESVPKLVRLAEALGVGVVEALPSRMNFPADHPLHLGYTTEEVIAEADVIVAVDTDVPWVAGLSAPSRSSRIYFVDDDPLKQDLPLWYMPSHRFIRADSALLLDQLLEELDATSLDESATRERQELLGARHEGQRRTWRQELAAEAGGAVTAARLASTLARLIDDDTVVINETISNATTVSRHLPRTRPDTLYANGGTSLGWSGGAAVGIKLARPDLTVVSLIGDGTYYFGVPSSVYWMAKRYGTPFLTVILDNGGWNATKQNLRKQYPMGEAEGTGQYWVNLAQETDLPGIAAAAGGAFAATVHSVSELEPTLIEALTRVKSGQSAVVAVRLAPISSQPQDVLNLL